MNRSTWMWAIALSLAGSAGSLTAQEYPGQGSQVPATIPIASWFGRNPRQAQPYCPTPEPPSIGDPKVQTPSTTQNPPAAPDVPEPPALRRYAGGNFYSSNLAQAGAGVSPAAAATGVGPLGTTSFQNPQNPVVLPGLLTAINAESATPMDRVFIAYSYLNGFQGVGFQVLRKQIVNTRSTIFNLNRLDLGIEKTFLDGNASVYVRLPFLAASDNVSGQQINGLGDASAGVKFVLWADRSTGSLVTGGLTVAAPTAHSTVFATQLSLDNSGSSINRGSLSTVATANINPTYIQPWVAALCKSDRFFIQEFHGVVIPTDSRVATFINNDVTAGYTIYRGEPGRLLSAITPILDVEALIPTSHVGTPTAGLVAVPPAAASPPSFGYSTQLFLTPGVQLGLGDRAGLSVGYSIPVVGPRAFGYGVSFGLNYFY